MLRFCTIHIVILITSVVGLGFGINGLANIGGQVDAIQARQIDFLLCSVCFIISLAVTCFAIYRAYKSERCATFHGDAIDCPAQLKGGYDNRNFQSDSNKTEVKAPADPYQAAAKNYVPFEGYPTAEVNGHTTATSPA